jgi:hypothetical protein
MNTLLEQAVEAHGGLANWKKHRAASLKLDVGGAIWQVKEQPGMFRDLELDASLDRQHISMTSRTAGWKGEFTPDLVRVETLGQDSVERRDAPRSAFEGHTQATPWDRLHALYFSGYALWSYLTIPFLYTQPGFETEELGEWEESGEVWRRLKAVFPDSIASHSREQISYFGQDGLLRRHDYTVDVMGGATGANYASDYREADGIVVPMTRRVFAYDEDRRKIGDPLLVSIDIHDVGWRA